MRGINSVVAAMEHHLSARDLSLSQLVEKLVHLSEPKMDNIPGFVFVAARVTKICQFPADQEKIRHSLSDRVAEVDMTEMANSSEIAQFLWSCRILNLKPENMQFSISKFTNATNKEFSNSIWALSKWNKDTDGGKKLHALLELLDDKKISNFSNQDLTTLVRCLAITVDNKF